MHRVQQAPSAVLASSPVEVYDDLQHHLLLRNYSHGCTEAWIT